MASDEEIKNLIVKDIYENNKSINVTDADIDFEFLDHSDELRATIKIINEE